MYLTRLLISKIITLTQQFGCYIPKQKEWIFIIGCNNSGTTLIKKILSESSQIASMRSEGQFYTKELYSDIELFSPRLWYDKESVIRKQLENADSIKVANNWFSWMNSRKKQYLLEKSPTNIYRLDWIQKKFNNPKFIFVIRNGYAVAQSIKNKLYCSNITEPTKHWLYTNLYMLNEFKKIDDDSKVLITYEELCNHPYETINNVLDHLKLSAKVSKTSLEKLNINNSNQERFGEIVETDRLIVKQIANDLLNKFHYTIER